MEILEIVEKIDDLVSSSARVPVAGKAVVNLEQLTALVDQLRDAVPEGIREARQILEKRDNILNQALMESRRIKAAADEEATARLDDNQISQDAQRRSEDMLSDAHNRSERLMGEVREQAMARIQGADEYAQEVLQKLDHELAILQETVQAGVASLRRVETEAPVEA